MVNPGFNPGLISAMHPMVTHNWWPLLAILLLLLTELV